MGSTSLSVTTGAADVFASLKEIRAPLKAVRSVTHIVLSFLRQFPKLNFMIRSFCCCVQEQKKNLFQKSAVDVQLLREPKMAMFVN